MTQLTVFVDDYVRGRLPGVCVVSGEPADFSVQHRISVDKPNPAWFILILFGPIGWIGLALVMMARRNYVDGWLPMKRSVHERISSQYRTASWALGIGLVGTLPALWIGAQVGRGVGISVFAASLTLAALGGFTHLRAEMTVPSLKLDGSRRWIRVRGAHHSFVDAAFRAQQDRPAHY